jgi:hypothetical protein
MPPFRRSRWQALRGVGRRAPGDAVEGCVVEVQSRDVTGAELDPNGAASRSATGFVDLRGARFNGDDGALVADEPGEGANELAGAAADIEQPVPEPGSKELGCGRA